jgi:hypothetical protein
VIRDWISERLERRRLRRAARRIRDSWEALDAVLTARGVSRQERRQIKNDVLAGRFDVARFYDRGVI